MRGQSLVFEQVILFMVGVAIFIVCFSLFGSYQAYFADISVVDQLNGVKDYITLGIVQLTQKSGEINSSISLEIPKVAADQPYRISLSENGITVTALNSGDSVFSPIYGLNISFEFQGDVLSSYGKCMIYKKGNKIIIS